MSLHRKFGESGDTGILYTPEQQYDKAVKLSFVVDMTTDRFDWMSTLEVHVVWNKKIYGPVVRVQGTVEADVISVCVPSGSVGLILTGTVGVTPNPYMSLSDIQMVDHPGIVINNASEKLFLQSLACSSPGNRYLLCVIL